ncbi:MULTISPECIES: ATP-binding cassette domain-containing protein [Streptomyces]|uniref:hypothetical protein n=1 Tax=Streptomyces TaxID=1883 RepID=UPI001D17631F|nr:hypothetical protein [Streptomyces sp. SYP-A7193]
MLDEPFEAIDPVSARSIEQVLTQYVDAGGTVAMSSHIMECVERNCRRVAVVVEGRVLLEGPVEQVAAGTTLNERFVELMGSPDGYQWRPGCCHVSARGTRPWSPPWTGDCPSR